MFNSKQQHQPRQNQPPTRAQTLASGLRELVRPCSHALHAYTDPALLYLMQDRPQVALRLMNTAKQEAERMLSNLETLQQLLPARSLNRLAELEQEATRSRSTSTQPPSSTTRSQTNTSSRSSSTRATITSSPISSRSPKSPRCAAVAPAAEASLSALELEPKSSQPSNSERKQSELAQLRKRAAMLRRDRDSLQVCVIAIVAHASTETKKVGPWN